MLSRKGKRTRQRAQPTGYHELYCYSCQEQAFTVATDIVRVTCGTCVQKIVAPPENYSKQASPTAGFPRGWHFKKRFEAPNGDVYSFGKLVDDMVDNEPEPEVEVIESKSKPSKRSKVNVKKKKVSTRQSKPRRKKTSS